MNNVGKLELLIVVALGLVAWWAWKRAAVAAAAGQANLQKVGEIQALGAVGSAAASFLV